MSLGLFQFRELRRNPGGSVDHRPRHAGVFLGFTQFKRHDPPIFEPQATYLKRHGFLLPGEERRLKKADWEPEAVSTTEQRDGAKGHVICTARAS